MGIASVVASSKVPEGQGKDYITAGDYLLQATGHKELTDDKLAFVANHDVLWSKAPSIEDPLSKPTRSAGLTASLYVDCLKFKGGLAGEVKAYLAALTKTPQQEIDAAGINAVLTTDQPCVGMLVRCKAWTHVTDNNKRVTKHKFSEATAEDVAQAIELRKAAGLEPLVAA